MIPITRSFLVVAATFFMVGAHLHAQDSGPLIDKLVQKGILTEQEATDLRADLVKDSQSSPAGKLNLSSSVMEMKLYGDGRLRYQYDDQKPQISSSSNTTQRSRFRYRLRLNADFRLTDNFFGGVQLETGQASDSANETVQPGYTDSSIYINRVFLGVNIGDWATVVAGKQKNPFYTTDLVWDPDISPYGITEAIAFDKLFPTDTGWGGFKLSLVAGQFVYNINNDESVYDVDANTDAFQFVTQLVFSYDFSPKTSITFAPGFMFYNAADLSGAVNETPFSSATGFVDNNGDGIADFTLDGFALTVTTGDVSGETRNLKILTAPGEIKFPVGALRGRFYWDLAYNLAGKDRYNDTYGFGLLIPSIGPADELVLTSQRRYQSRDALAWLVGLEIGNGKGKGAWSIFANYRENGIASVDPNINDADFAFGHLNSRGFQLGATYDITDSVSLSMTGLTTYNIDPELQDQAGLANTNDSNVFRLDVNFKF